MPQPRFYFRTLALSSLLIGITDHRPSPDVADRARLALTCPRTAHTRLSPPQPVARSSIRRAVTAALSITFSAVVSDSRAQRTSVPCIGLISMTLVYQLQSRATFGPAGFPSRFVPGNLAVFIHIAPMRSDESWQVSIKQNI